MLFKSLSFSRQLATHYSIDGHWVTWYKTHTDVINVIMFKQKKQLYFLYQEFCHTVQKHICMYFRLTDSSFMDVLQCINFPGRCCTN